MLLVVPICLNFRFQLAREHPFPCLGSAGETAFGFRDCARGVVDIKLFFFALPKIKKSQQQLRSLLIRSCCNVGARIG